MPLQSPGVIVVDKTSSVISTTSSSSSAGAIVGVGGAGKLPCRPNGLAINAISGVLHTSGLHESNDIDVHHTIPISVNNTKLVRRRGITTTAAAISSTKSTFNNNHKNNNNLTLATHVLDHQQTQQMNQINQQQQQQQHHQQVLVSEEYIEQNSGGSGTPAGSTGVISVSANDLINQTQIIKFVSDGNGGGNMVIDTSGGGSGGSANTTANGSTIISSPHHHHHNHHGNSKVHVISNVTLVSKQQVAAAANVVQQQHQQQTINFVNAKNLPYITTGKNQNQIGSVQKIVNIPLKANHLLKNATGQQILHHSLASAGGGSGGGIMSTGGGTTMMQKVNVPRNVQVVTRVQAITPATPQQHHHSQQQQVQNQIQQPNQLVMQQKYMQSIVTTQGNNGKVGIVSAMKKQNTNQSMKVVQKNVANHSNTGSVGMKTFIQQQQIQTISATATGGGNMKMKSQKVIRFNNNQHNAGSGMALNLQQAQQQQLLSSPGGYSISNTKLNNISGLPQNLIETTKLVGTAPGKNTPIHATGKYIMQNNMILQSPGAGGHSGGTKIANSSANNIVVQQHILHTGNSTGCASGGGGSTIKYVNAQGTVVHSPHHQQQHQTSASPAPQTIQQIKQAKGRANSAIHHQQQQVVMAASAQQFHASTQGHVQFVDGRSSVSPSGADNVFLSHCNSAGNPQTTTVRQASNEDIMIVNGTQMTEEMSARILQSLSQKAIYNNTRQYQQQHAVQQSSAGQQQNHSQQMQKITAANLAQQNSNLMLATHEHHPIYNSAIHLSHHQPQQQQQQQHIQPTKNYRSHQTASKSQLAERKRQQEAEAGKHPMELAKVKGDNQSTAQEAEQEDDSIGEEVRPLAVMTPDARIQALYAVLQDHTYVAAMPTRFPMELAATSVTTSVNVTTTAMTSSTVFAANHTTISSCGPVESVQMGCGQTLGVPTLASAGGLPANIVGYPYGQEVHNHHADDDANSVISNESRTGHHGQENDLGEETETAPEAEAEDDSITRCICEQTHDDGYMICCDKCLAWQHVDCMAIDRQNIPEEYLCEICEPRPVDRKRAIELQTKKRKEQSLMLMNAQMVAAGVGGGILLDGQLNPTLHHDGQLLDGVGVQHGGVGGAAGLPGHGKKGKVGALMGGKKKELAKRTKKDRSATKRRDSKRVNKRKTKSQMNSSTESVGNDSLSQWIENYEVAMTNHYSPELRARLHAITKQQNILQSIVASENRLLKSCAGMDSKCTTVPHAGGKILISNLDIAPQSPIVELRGKFMLTTQYKTQNPSVNMNINPPNGLQNLKNSKSPGPFVFFYNMSGSGPEVCVDTRTYGNEARFVRRSCRPNAEIQHSFEKGTVHLYIVSLTNIMASTEITIRHEPHDLAALENKNFTSPIAPTSTMCGCGLTKDCAFGGPNLIVAKQPPPQRKAVNGFMGGETNKSLPVRKNSQKVARGRSTSSSGESNAALLSPNNNFNLSIYNSATTITNLMHDSGVYTSSSSPSVSLPSPTHLQTVSSPPQEQIAQVAPPQVVPTLDSIASVAVSSAVMIPQQQSPQQQFPQQQFPQQQCPQQQCPQQQCPQQQSPQQQCTQEILQSPTAVICQQPAMMAVVSSNSVPKSPQKSNPPSRKNSASKQARTTSISEESSAQQLVTSPTAQTQSEKRESRKLTREERKMEAIVKAFEKMEKNQQRKQELKQARTSSTSSTAKRRGSSSPSPKRVKSNSTSEGGVQEIANTPEAQQAARKAAAQNNRKKKRKGSKSYNSASSSQRKRRKSRMNSNESDIVTSEESMPLLSPPLPPSGGRPNFLPLCLPSPSQDDTLDRPVFMSTGGLTPDNCEPNADMNVSETQQDTSVEMESTSNENIENALNLVPIDHHQGATSVQMVDGVVHLHQTAPILSSACLLVEAAVGPLESFDTTDGGAFRLPLKTKTKKSIMNDWLNQSSDYHHQVAMHHHQSNLNLTEEEQYHQPAVVSTVVAPPVSSPGGIVSVALIAPHFRETLQQQPQFQMESVETMMRASPTQCGEYRRATSSPASFMQAPPPADEPQNLSMMAKKVEEFIHQTDLNNLMCNEEIKFETGCEASPQAATVVSPMQSITTINNNCSATSSSVKKRWLRQAISEECTDELATTLSIQSNQSQNGFTTPLKKRRVITPCEDEDDKHSVIPVEETTIVKTEIPSPVCADDESTTEVFKKEVDIEEVVPEEITAVELIKQETFEPEDDVDIMRSPSPSEKIVAEDNLVKIEPEDTNKEIKVDVEKEESCSSEIVAKKIDPLITIVEQDIKLERKIEDELEGKTEEKQEPETVQPNENFEPLKVDEVKEEDVKKVEMDVLIPIVEEEQKEEIEETVVKIDSPEMKISEFEIQKIEPPQKEVPETVAVVPTIVATQLKNEEIPLPKDEPQLETVEVSATGVSSEKSVSDEIADIQKRLHSFHTENIMILQSRNKKSKISRAIKLDKLKATDVDDFESTKSKANLEASSMKNKEDKLGRNEKTDKSEKPPKSTKKKHFNFDETNRVGDRKLQVISEKEPIEAFPVVASKDAIAEDQSTFVGSRIETIESMTKEEFDEKQIHAALTIPNFNQNVMPPTTPMSSYVLTGSNQSYDMTSLLSGVNPPPQSSQILMNSASHPSALHLPYYNTIYGKLIDNPSSTPVASPVPVPAVTPPVVVPPTPSLTTPNLLLSDYLDTKVKSYSTLGGYVSHTALFGLNIKNKSNPIGGDTLSSSSTTSTTTSSVTKNGEVTSPTASAASNSSASSSLSKILTKTASADPRLNPSLTAPEPPPAPKRKLSINEYRKRKQQSNESSTCGSGGNQNSNDSQTSTKSSSNLSQSSSNLSNGDASDYANNANESESYSSDKVTEPSTVQFSAAPTLLEQQQETLCERIKSLKSKSAAGTGLSLNSSDSISSSAVLSASNLSLTNCDSKKEESSFSSRQRGSTSSLESISSSSPISSKASTPERE